jgi:hypothetical protein
VLRGALLLLGPTAPQANVYALTDSGLQQLTHVSGRGVGVTTVTANASRIVVGDNAVQQADRIDEVRSGALHDLGIAGGFAPALSTAGALAWVALDQSAPTPGISKPKGFVVGLRNSLHGKTSIVYRTPLSMGSPQWIGAHQLLVAASDGTSTRIVRVDTTSGAGTVLSTIGRNAALNLTAGPSSVSVTDDNGSGVVVSLAGKTQGPLPTGWAPLCWLSGASLLAAHGGRLATIGFTAGQPGRPQEFATIPSGLNAYGAACGRIKH